jgi:hypothetical protein
MPFFHLMQGLNLGLGFKSGQLSRQLAPLGLKFSQQPFRSITSAAQLGYRHLKIGVAVGSRKPWSCPQGLTETPEAFNAGPICMIRI